MLNTVSPSLPDFDPRSLAQQGARGAPQARKGADGDDFRRFLEREEFSRQDSPAPRRPMGVNAETGAVRDPREERDAEPRTTETRRQDAPEADSRPTRSEGRESAAPTRSATAETDRAASDTAQPQAATLTSTNEATTETPRATAATDATKTITDGVATAEATAAAILSLQEGITLAASTMAGDGTAKAAAEATPVFAGPIDASEAATGAGQPLPPFATAGRGQVAQPQAPEATPDATGDDASITASTTATATTTANGAASTRAETATTSAASGGQAAASDATEAAAPNASSGAQASAIATGATSSRSAPKAAFTAEAASAPSTSSITSTTATGASGQAPAAPLPMFDGGTRPALDASGTDFRPQGSPRDAAPPERVAFEVASAVKAGVREIQVTLDPPELGRIDLSIDVDEAGAVTTRLVVEKSETLDQLRRDAQNIERLLEQQGLKTSGDGLQFSLRDQGQGQNGTREQPRKKFRAEVDIAGVNSWRTADASAARAASRGGVDVRL